jgi:uncharacterized membrane protein YeiH
VLSFATACIGGIARDVLIGDIPPSELSDWRYLAASLLAGLIAFGWHSLIQSMHSPVLLFDAAGLALFAVTGAHKSLGFGLHPVMAALLGMLTGIGGGMVRDVLLAKTPKVLRSNLYALAALAGAVVEALGILLGLPPAATAVTGALLCFLLRVAAIRRVNRKVPRVDTGLHGVEPRPLPDSRSGASHATAGWCSSAAMPHGED